jgi:hypothetical protein
MAGAVMARRDLAQQRRIFGATRHRVRAAGMEVATRGRCDRTRDLTLDGGELPLAGIDARHLGKQRLGVRMVA